MAAIKTKRQRIAVGFVGAAEAAGLLPACAVLVPLTSMLAMLGTVATCLRLWRASKHYVPGMVFPAISELGVEPPQQRIYQVGFAVCGLILGFGILMFEGLLQHELVLTAPEPTKDAPKDASFKLHPMWGGAADEKDKGGTARTLRKGARVRLDGLKGAAHLNGETGVLDKLDDTTGRWHVRLKSGETKALKAENLTEVAKTQPDKSDPESAIEALAMAEQTKVSATWGYATAAGVVLQGVFTLQHQVSPQSLVHWGGAILFIGGAMQHAKASNEVYELAKERGAPLLQHASVIRAFKLRRFILQYSNIVVFVLPLLMQVMPALVKSGADGDDENQEEPPVIENEDGDEVEPLMDPKMMNAMGLMQWAIIFQFAVFFCAYIFDLLAAARMRAERAAAAKSK